MQYISIYIYDSISYLRFLYHQSLSPFIAFLHISLPGYIYLYLLLCLFLFIISYQWKPMQIIPKMPLLISVATLHFHLKPANGKLVLFLLVRISIAFLRSPLFFHNNLSSFLKSCKTILVDPSLHYAHIACYAGSMFVVNGWLYHV